MTAKVEQRDAVPVGKLHPNPWNPNKMNDRTFEAERESIAKFGFVDPVTVRPHPDLKAQFQIIDGEHRWRAAGDLKIKSVPVVILRGLSDHEAKKLTIVLNETRGQADTIDLAALLADIKTDDPNLLEALPYTQEQLDNLVALADLDDWERDLGDGSKEPGAKGEGEWKTLTVKLPADVLAMFEQVRDMVKEQGAAQHDDEAIANGQVLEVLCAEYVAGVQVQA